MTTRYVVLQFDDGDRFDYEPPLPHPADIFLERFPTSTTLNADIGATSAVEIDRIHPQCWFDQPCPDEGIPVLYSPQDPHRDQVEAFREWTA